MNRGRSPGRATAIFPFQIENFLRGVLGIFCLKRRFFFWGDATIGRFLVSLILETDTFNPKPELSMKPSLCSLLLFVALLNMAFDCSDKDENNLPAEVRYRLLNEQGEETTRFREGENVTFSLVISNRSEQTINIYGFPFADVGTVRRLDMHSSESGMMGKPHSGFKCTYDNNPFIFLPRSTHDVRISWIPKSTDALGVFCIVQKNSPLPKGRYRTEFSTPISFSIDGGDMQTTDPYRFSIDFEIK
ncbi:MAG: hypothetical protein MUD08_04075 [Cytophagales bacterium]|jgi:hypothetical protein|nr:hypothetical protein [Cytophagales bacterium]